MKESEAMNSMKLTSENVKAVFKNCLLRNKKEVKSPKMVEGIRTTVGLHPGRLEEHYPDIVALCDQLPDTFKKSAGGGWSFLNLCMNSQFKLWTGDHADMEQLMILGLAIGKIELLAPRSMWIAFPGGMPYLVVKEDDIQILENFADKLLKEAIAIPQDIQAVIDKHLNDMI